MGATKIDNRRKAFTQKDRKECEAKRYQFRAKKSKHPLAEEPLYIAHEYDRDNPLDKRYAKLDNEAWIDLFDPNLDAKAGLYYMKWTSEDLKQFIIGLATDVLVTLRDIEFDSADDTTDAKDIFEWVLSDSYSILCLEVGLNADELRYGLATKLLEMDKEKPSWFYLYIHKLRNAVPTALRDSNLTSIEEQVYRMH